MVLDKRNWFFNSVILKNCSLSIEMVTSVCGIFQFQIYGTCGRMIVHLLRLIVKVTSITLTYMKGVLEGVIKWTITSLLCSYLCIFFALQMLSEKIAKIIAKVSKNELLTSCVHKGYLLKSRSLVTGQTLMNQAGNAHPSPHRDCSYALRRLVGSWMSPVLSAQ